jgi:hypothetical protein
MFPTNSKTTLKVVAERNVLHPKKFPNVKFPNVKDPNEKFPNVKYPRKDPNPKVQLFFSPERNPRKLPEKYPRKDPRKSLPKL